MNATVSFAGPARNRNAATIDRTPMQRINHNDDDDNGLVALLKEAADGFGCLMAAHVKLARVELLADVKSFGRRLTILAAIIPFAFLGYASLCMGLAVVLSPWLGIAGALFLVGGLHVVGATGALLLVGRRLRNTDLMSETTHEAGQSVSTLTMRVLHGQAAAGAPPLNGVNR